MKIISYSLFGYDNKFDECFDFNSYLRGLNINIRLARLLFPEWVIRLHIDDRSYTPFKDLFDNLPIQIEICKETQLTKAMLWRLKPCFDINTTHVICRDLDSPLTYRDAQAVQFWVNRVTKAAHAITDSISHNIPMMGGMIGFKTEYFQLRTGFNSWDEMFMNANFDFSKKGTDQDFINHLIYPKFAQHGIDSITQHYVKGMPNTFLSDYHNTIQDWIEIPNVDRCLKEADNCAGHIGAAGYYPPPTYKFLNKHKHKFADIRNIELKYQDIFTWAKEIEI